MLNLAPLVLVVVFQDNWDMLNLAPLVLVSGRLPGQLGRVKLGAPRLSGRLPGQLGRVKPGAPRPSEWSSSTTTGKEN